MRYLSDLHIHSVSSDGQYAPTELVHMVRKRGIDAVRDSLGAVQAGFHNSNPGSSSNFKRLNPFV